MKEITEASASVRLLLATAVDICTMSQVYYQYVKLLKHLVVSSFEIDLLHLREAPHTPG